MGVAVATAFRVLDEELRLGHDVIRLHRRWEHGQRDRDGAIASEASSDGFVVADAHQGAAAGSAQLAIARAGELSASDLSDMVCSPGGTTIAGLLAAEEAGFTTSIVAAVDATVAPDKELGS